MCAALAAASMQDRDPFAHVEVNVSNRMSTRSACRKTTV